METDNQKQNGQEPAQNPTTPKRTFDSLISAIRKGSEDARRAAEHAIPKIKTAASQADYWAGYGIAFAAVFSSTVIKGFTPESLKSGLRDGVKSGRKSGEEWVETFKHGRNSPETVALLGPTSHEAQPGVS